MSNLKKKMPVIILETLEPILKKGQDKIRLVDPGGFLIKFIDKDPNSEFHFQIEEQKNTNSGLTVLISQKPRSKEIVDFYRAWIQIKTLEQSFSDWISLIDRYDKIESIYDDPIEKKYQQEFYGEFEILDTDADIVSYDLDQQLFLDNYLEKVIQVIEQHNSENNNESLNEIKGLVVELKNELTKLTKKKVIEKLSRIWAKTRKVGLPILKEIYIQVRNELIKQLVQGRLELG